MEWYRKAAEQGFPPAQYNLGRLYLYGDGVEEDIGAARFFGSATLSGGDLTYYEVVGLDIKNAPLVVLSACDTGRGDIRSGDEVYSLANAFMHAQARAVVFTLWPVDDQATKELMGEFYSEFERTGNGTVALADAQRAMIENGYSTELWAGFVFSAWSAPRSP